MTSAKKIILLVGLLLLIMAVPMLSAQPDGTLVYGATVSTDVNPGEQRVYTFEGAEGDLIVAHALELSQDFNLNLRLLDPTGTPLTASSPDPLDPLTDHVVLRYILPTDGLYQMNVVNTGENSGEFILTIEARQVEVVGTLARDESLVIDISNQPQSVEFQLDPNAQTTLNIVGGSNAVYSAEVLDDRAFVVARVDRFVTAATLTLPPGPERRYQVIVASASNQASQVTLSLGEGLAIIPAPVADAPSGGSCINDSEFVSDITIPDGTEMRIGEPFTKTWRFRNTGTCTWQGYQLVPVDMDELGFIGQGRAVTIRRTAPNETVDISVDIVLADRTEVGATVRTLFEIRDATGQAFGLLPYVEVVAIAAD